MKTIKLLISLVVLMLLACGSTIPQARVEKRPTWIDDPEREFPHEMYISSIGMGSTQESAQNSAIAGIAKVFQSDIKLREQVEENYFESGTDKELELQQSVSLSKQMSVTTDQSLKNITIGKTWHDKQTAQFYALAYIDRSQTAAIYLGELERADQDVTTLFKGYIESSDKLTKLAYLNKALLRAIVRNVLEERLSVISPGSGSRFMPTATTAELISERQKLREMISLMVEIENNEWSDFNNAVKIVLNSFGFRIVTEAPDYILRGGFSIERLERKGYYVRWHCDLHFIEAASGSELITYSKDGREGHTSYADAEYRAERSAKKEIGKTFYKEIENYLNSMVGNN